jgi:hypothetical protein
VIGVLQRNATCYPGYGYRQPIPRGSALIEINRQWNTGVHRLVLAGAAITTKSRGLSGWGL